MPKLENWGIAAGFHSVYTAPELIPSILIGEVYDDDRFDEGSSISTSRIEFIDFDNKIAKTRNTTYELGEPNDSFVEYCEDKGIKLTGKREYIQES